MRVAKDLADAVGHTPLIRLRKASEEGPQIIATGGGAFMDPETRAAVKENGISVWLRHFQQHLLIL